jgi:glycosyltransferase involved in cell wall biosynthesis
VTDLRTQLCESQADLRTASASRSKLISVVIPTHNRASMVGVAIASVLRSPLIDSAKQVIVVDDDSADDTEEVVRPFGVKYIRVACRSTSGSRNAGFGLVQTPYVTFLDDDDAWLAGNMDEQLSALEAHPEAAFAYGVTQCATDDLEPLPWTYPSPPLASGIVSERLHLAYPQLGVVLFRREVIAGIGGFDLRISYYEDGDLLIRVAARHEIIGVPSVGILHRIRDPSRERDDYHWSNRNGTLWRPKGVGIGWRTRAKFCVGMKSLFFGRFVEDAFACAKSGQRRDAFICLMRAVYFSPPHAGRHFRKLAWVLRECLAAQPRRGRMARTDP